jgi:hypothetical protein
MYIVHIEPWKRIVEKASVQYEPWKQSRKDGNAFCFAWIVSSLDKKNNLSASISYLKKNLYLYKKKTFYTDFINVHTTLVKSPPKKSCAQKTDFLGLRQIFNC